MDRSDLNLELFHRLLTQSFDRPLLFPKLVDEEVSRSRSMRSSTRREMSTMLYDAIRWRRRIWGDIAPSALDLRFVEKLKEAQNLRANPPLSKWSSLSMDALAREVSYPGWIIERWVSEMGFTSAVALALSMNEPAPVSLRVNTLKTDRASAISSLKKEDIHAEAGRLSPWSLQLTGRRNVRALPLFKRGGVELQDEGSQLVVLATGAKAGERVVDACCGSGGKALALAQMMENKGEIYATDSDSRFLPRLEERGKRAGAKILKGQWVAQDDPNPLSHLKEKADVVLVDVPCSSLGVLRRKPWLKWGLTSEAISSLPAKQLSLISRYSRLVKLSGRLVYATCTIYRAENEDVVQRFQDEVPGFRLTHKRTLRPDTDNTDGFFMAELSRDGSRSIA